MYLRRIDISSGAVLRPKMLHYRRIYDYYDPITDVITLELNVFYTIPNML